MLVVYRACLWMPFFTALLAVASGAWLIWSISLPSYAMMLPSGFGIMVFTMTSVIGFVVRKRMIEADLIAQERGREAIQFLVSQMRDDTDREFLEDFAERNGWRTGMLSDKELWQNERTTTSQSS